MTSVLITNDDGIHADGLRALAALAGAFFDRVWVAAPKEQASQIGHRVTTDRPIRYDCIQHQWIAVDGSPADCVRVGLHLMGQKPDWVWSGINHGGNLGLHDYFISGTLAAAREAAFFGVRALGVSHFLKHGLDLNWELAASRAAQAIREILPQAAEMEKERIVWNINLPHLHHGERDPGVVFCEQEPQPLGVAFAPGPEENTLVYRGVYHERPRQEGSDVAVCFGGDIAVSRLRV